ncbi:unnamed protein product [Schistosoma curassoni]|uniref:Uncharacterized protein n=1 Tax=Schistosoma curassoni TaxID=6186 RepID=A0A183K7Z8_9TREM|nr:unnamed protein product [Schistosoma curassoni]
MVLMDCNRTRFEVQSSLIKLKLISIKYLSVKQTVVSIS